MNCDFGVARIETRKRYYGVRATLLLPKQLPANNCVTDAGMNGYIALLNPLVQNDPRLKVGVIRCAAPGLWALFVWSPLTRFEGGICREVEIELLPGGSHEFQLRFARNDHRRFELFVNGCVVWRDTFAKPISRSIYDDGGLIAKLGVGASYRWDTTLRDRMQWCRASGAVDPLCERWEPLVGVSANTNLSQSSRLAFDTALGPGLWPARS
jgi:hypothetical protein